MLTPIYPTTVNLIQAVRTLIYAPIYLSKQKLIASGITLNIINPKDEYGNEIVGDAESFKEFIASDNIHFCICDPMMVPLYDPELKKNVIIIGVLINKVALWAMTKNRHIRDQVFNTAFLVDKNVVSYSKPSTAGAVSVYYKIKMSKLYGSTFHKFDTDNGLELQYLDLSFDDKKIDVVITADLLAYEAHYQYNNARPVHYFSKDWDKFFFTGIITKKQMIQEGMRNITEKVLKAIKESIFDLYDFHRIKRQLPASFLDELVKDIKKYTCFHLHPQFSTVNIDERFLVDKTLNEYIESGIPAEKIAIDFDSFDKAFQLRKTVENIDKSSRYYYSKCIDNSMSESLDKEFRERWISWKRFALRIYNPFIKRYKIGLAIFVSAVGAIVFNIISKGSILVILVSLIAFAGIAFFVEFILRKIGEYVKNI